MFDIDHFKKLNDLHGHEYGDECLRIIGKTLKELEEKFHCAFFRYGGEEFLAIIDNGYDKESLLNMAKIIKLAIDATKIAFQDEQKQFLTISIGVAICERKDSGGNIAMIDCADKALYLAKETGRDKIVFYDDEVEEKLVLLGKEFISSVRHRDTVSKNKKSV